MSTTYDICEAVAAAQRDDRPTLSFFGRDNEHLEKQVIIWLLDHGDKPLIRKIIPFLRENYFERPIACFLFGFMSKEMEKTGVIPTRGEIQLAMSKSMNEDDHFTIYEEIKNWLNTKFDVKCAPYFKGEFIEQLKAKAYYQAYISEATRALLDAKDYDALDRLFVNCFPQPDEGSILRFEQQLDEILAPSNVASIGTGFPTLDSYMHDRGAARGEVLVFLGNTGGGKSTMLQNSTQNLRKLGLKILYVCLEGTKEAIGQRLASIAADVPTKTISDHAGVVSRAVHAHNGEVVLLQPPEHLTVSALKNKIELLALEESFQPDVICVDYAKLLKSQASSRDPEYAQLARTMDDLKRLALETNTLLLTAQQANREGEGAAVVGLKHAATSYDAMQPVDYVVSINTTEVEEMNNQMRLVINKNRHGPEGKTICCDTHRISGLIKERI